MAGYDDIVGASSWLLDSLASFVDGSGDDDVSYAEHSEESSCTSYSTESSEGFILDDNYMIIPKENGGDDISDIVDSVDDDNRSTDLDDSESTGMFREDPSYNYDDESEDYEAFLRSKMCSLWYQIQESANIVNLTETPSTTEDTKLLDSYGKKKSLIHDIHLVSTRAR